MESGKKKIKHSNSFKWKSGSAWLGHSCIYKSYIEPKWNKKERVRTNAKLKNKTKHKQAQNRPASLTRLHPEPCCNGINISLSTRSGEGRGGNSWRESSSLTLTPWAVCSQITGCIVSMLNGWTSFFFFIVEIWVLSVVCKQKTRQFFAVIFFPHFLKWIPVAQPKSAYLALC